MSDLTAPTHYKVTQKNKMLAAILMGVGLASIAYGFFSGDSTRIWASLLMGNFYLLAIALASVFFVAVQLVAEVGWSASIIRIPMAIGQYVPFAAAFMIIIFLAGHHDLYHWTHPELYDKNSPEYDRILDGKSGFLNMGFYTFRLVAYALIWSGFAFLLRRESLREDLEPGYGHHNKNVKLAATFLVLFGVTSSTGAWDILMSIDAHWFSTLFGWYTFAGLFVSGMTVIAMFTVYLKRNGYLPQVNENHIHDLGKFMFAFSVFWTYLWFAQFMLIWYANLPEEVLYYKFRQDHFHGLWLANVFINFFTPFLVMMTRDAKRRDYTVLTVGVIMLIGHWIDVYLMVMPGTMGSHATIGIVEIGTTLFFAGLLIWVTFHQLAKHPLQPKNHPMLKESYHFQL